MPTTFLLLRNNQQTGPHSLDVLLQHVLKPHDLIWVEGQSAGWCYPSEVPLLKPYLSDLASPVPQQPPRTIIPLTEKTKTATNKQLHIYVSLPAGRTITQPEETSTSSSLEEKAAALYQRVHTFSEGHNEEETDTRYGRSLDDMKQEYGAWLVQQQKKKKWGSLKKKVLIAASVLVMATTGFGVNKWIRYKSYFKQNPIASYALGTLTQQEKKQSVTPVSEVTTNAFVNAPLKNNTLPKDTIAHKPAVQKSSARLLFANKKIKDTGTKSTVKIASDTAAKVPALASLPPKETSRQEVKKTIPLSQLVTVDGMLQDDENRKHGTVVTLHNNSSETLKSVAVLITYLKKEDRQLNNETLYFYNVAPGSAPVLTASGNRRATTAHFEIGTIIRADGSLYLIH